MTCAFDQTRQPLQIVIVDASDDWQDHHNRIETLVGQRVPLIYLPASARSSAVQRNAAIAACSADICVLIDDDSLMHPDCIEVILRAYEADTRSEILGIAGADGPSPLKVQDVARKDGTASRGLAGKLTGLRIAAFLWRELFLMNRAATFIPYDGSFG